MLVHLWFEVEVSQDGHVHYQRFERGNPTCDLKVIGDTEETGTLIRFKADPEIFTETTVYEFETLERRLREQAFLNAGLSISLTDKRDVDEVKEVYEDGNALLSSRTDGNKIVEFIGPKELYGNIAKVKITVPKSWLLKGEYLPQ